MTELRSVSGSFKALLLFVLPGPIVGTFGWLVIAIFLQAPNPEIQFLRFLAVTGLFLGMVVALIAGVMFLVLAHLALLRKGSLSSLATICALGASTGALSSWFFFGLFGFSASVENKFIFTGSLCGAFCAFLCRQLLVDRSAPNQRFERDRREATLLGSPSALPPGGPSS